jgi:hypothetical protein
MRDARITPIYEGTNGIQALDLIGRKLPMDGGAHWRALFDEMRDFIVDLPRDGTLSTLRPYLEDALDALNSATIWMMGNNGDGLNDSAAGATPYLRMFGITMGGYLMARQAVAAAAKLGLGEGDPKFFEAKIITARFYIEQIVPQVTALLGPVTRGSELFFALDEAQFLAA